MPPQMMKLKIVIIGPSSSGKTAIANFLSESVNGDTYESKPTKGVRIVEFEMDNLVVSNRQLKANIELWDCSGDYRYESCWPAIRLGVQGVILVCSSNNQATSSRNLGLLYNYFVTQPGLTPKQCVLFYNAMDQQESIKSLKLSSTFTKVSQTQVSVTDGGNKLRLDFANFITSVISTL